MLETDLKGCKGHVPIKHVQRMLYVLKADPKEAVESIYISIKNNSICAKGRPKEAVKSIYMIHNLICARGRPKRTVRSIYMKIR